MEYLQLNKKEMKFIDTIDDDEIMYYRKLKTFLRELKKVERRHGYEPHEATIMNVISYWGCSHYDSIEGYIYSFEDMTEASEKYFLNYY